MNTRPEEQRTGADGDAGFEIIVFRRRPRYRCRWAIKPQNRNDSHFHRAPDALSLFDAVSRARLRNR